MRRRLAFVFIILLVFLSLAGLGLQALTRWNWGGPALLDLIQAKVNGKITAGRISGNPITGLTFENLAIAGPDGQLFLQTARLELRLSLSSILAGHLIIARLSFSAPLVHAVQASGQWNLNKLLKPAAPPEAPGIIARVKASYLQRVDLRQLLVDRGEILVIRQGCPTRYHGLSLSSDLTILHPGKPEQEIKVQQADLGVTAPQGRLQFSTRLAYGAGRAKIDSLTLKLAGETVLSMQGELCQPAAGLSCEATGRLGPLKGVKIREFWGRWPGAWDLAGGFKYRGTPQGANLQTQGNIGQAGFDLQGEFAASPATFALKGSLRGLTTGQFKEIKGLRTEQIRGLSPVNAKILLEGTGLPWNPETMKGALDLEPFRYREVQVSKLTLNLQGDARRQDFHGIFAGNFGKVEVDSRGRLLPLGEGGQEIKGDLTWRTENFRPAVLGLPQYSGTELTSSFSGRFRLPTGFSLTRLYLAGDLSAGGRLENEPLKSLQAKFVLSGERLDIARAEMKLASGEAVVKGMISRTGADLTFSAAIASSRNLPVRTGGSFSNLTGNGTIRGAWKSLQIDLSAQARQLASQGATLQTASLKASLSGWPPQSGNLALQGAKLQTRAGTFSRVDLHAQGQGGNWTFKLAATSPQYPRLEMAGTADLSGRPLSFDIRQISWQSQGLTIKNKTPFQVRVLPGYEITPAIFQVDGGAVTLQAKARGNELSGRLEVQNLDAALLKAADYDILGKLNGRATLSGSPREPELHGQFTVAGGRIQDVKINALSMSFKYHPDNLQVSGYLQAGPEHSRLNWQGTVPVKFSVIPWQFVLAHQGLDLQVQSEKINLSLLTAFTPEMQAAQAPVDMRVAIKGDPHRPVVSGYVRWGAGSLQPRLAGLAYRLQPGEARLQGNKVTISGLTLESQGTLTISGNLDLTGASRVDARVQGFQVMDRGGNQIWLDGAAHLQGPLSHLVVNGRITIPKALLRPTLFSGGLDPDVVLVDQKTARKKARLQPSLYQNMQIEIPITSHGNVRLKDPKGQAELAVELKATKKPGQALALGGRVHALKGTLTVENRPFKIDKAIVTLPGVPGRPNRVDVRATYEIGNHDLTIILLVTGTAANPQVTLESNPPLPPTDVLSYLVFGGPAASLTNDQFIALGAQGVGGMLTNQKSTAILGAALPYLSKSGASGPSPGIKKEITKNVSVSYRRKLNELTNQYETQAVIEYKVNRHLSVDSQIAPRNTGADVLYNYEW